jgi:hypothetical protein
MATEQHDRGARNRQNGWEAGLARFCMAVLVFLMVSGLAITLLPFHAVTQWSVLVHTGVGVLTLLPLTLYCVWHWREYRGYAASHITVLGYVGLVSLALCLVSGVVVTWQGLFGIRTTGLWRMLHLVTTLTALAAILPHVLYSLARVRPEESGPVRGYALWSLLGPVGGLALIGLFATMYSGTRYVNEFPEDYSYLYGENRPFAPSLAQTDTGGAFDARSLAGSVSCGTTGCHEQILEEWLPSAHRYAAMDTVFQGIQSVMAEQNGPESTRYCGGCHDPISLFSGTKNIFVDDLTGLHGYQEGVSCLACHAITETDLQGNAAFTVTQPREYLWQWHTNGLARWARDFLIRTYPREHTELSRRMFKTPEYCGACHKQFIDEEVNRVGWVQLQNQYDNWAVSHWNVPGDPARTVECRECHMPLVSSRDPAAGDPYDYNRSPKDGKHRSHRFLGANQWMPEKLDLEGWREHVRLTELWLQGRIEIPEIESKWATGPIVKLALSVPETVKRGESVPLRVVMASNKVGHDFPTGPLDIIQSWLKVRVTDEAGNTVFTSGTRDEDHFIEPGTFLFKAEPVDRFGNLIDRHNLWEMVGVRYRRALFPGYSDTVQYAIPCSGALAEGPVSERTDRWEHDGEMPVPVPGEKGMYDITVTLEYRKVDQSLLNYLFGESQELTSRVTEIARATTSVRVE